MSDVRHYCTKACQGRAHQQAKHLFDQNTLGEQFATQIVKQSPIGRGMLKMAEIDRKVMRSIESTNPPPPYMGGVY